MKLAKAALNNGVVLLLRSLNSEILLFFFVFFCLDPDLNFIKYNISFPLKYTRMVVGPIEISKGQSNLRVLMELMAHEPCAIMFLDFFQRFHQRVCLMCKTI